MNDEIIFLLDRANEIKAFCLLCLHSRGYYENGWRNEYIYLIFNNFVCFALEINKTNKTKIIIKTITIKSGIVKFKMCGKEHNH